MPRAVDVDRNNNCEIFITYFYLYIASCQRSVTMLVKPIEVCNNIFIKVFCK